MYHRHLRTLDPTVIKTDVDGLNEIADNFKIKTETDNQLNYAIKLLNG